MKKKYFRYINTKPLWEDMSAIAQEAIEGIENVVIENGKEIETSYGTLYYDKGEEEVYIKDDEYAEKPLRETDTQYILEIADEVNEWIDNNQNQ